MVLFPLHLGVEQAHVALAATPEHIVGSSQLDGGVDRVLDLDSSPGDNTELRVGGGPIHISLMSENIGCTPKEFDASGFHLLERIVGDDPHALLIFGDGGSFLDEIHIMEAEVLDTQFLHDLESGVHLILCPLYRITRLIPLVLTCLSAELVAAGLAKGVPPCHGEFQPILHPLSEHHAIRLIIMERQWTLALWSLEGNLSNLREILFHDNDNLCFKCYYSDDSSNLNIPLNT